MYLFEWWTMDAKMQRKLPMKILHQLKDDHLIRGGALTPELSRLWAAIDNVTLVVHTHDAVACLERLVFMMTHKFMRMRMIVLDSSNFPVPRPPLPYFLKDSQYLTYMVADPSITPAAAWNRLVSAVCTPYVLFMQDHYALPSPEDHTDDAALTFEPPLFLEVRDSSHVRCALLCVANRRWSGRVLTFWAVSFGTPMQPSLQRCRTSAAGKSS